MSFEVDWDKHEFYLASAETASFTLDEKKGVIGQIAESLEILVTYMEATLKKFPVAQLEGLFFYSKGIVRGSKEHEEAHKYLNLGVLNDKDAKEIKDFENEFYLFRVRPGTMDETELCFAHRR